MKFLKGLMFDVDGTLANTEEAHRQAFNQVFSENGLKWHWSQSRYKELLRVSGGVERMLHYAEDENLTIPSDDAIAFVRELHRRKTTHYNQLLQSGEVKLRSGVERLLRQAREHKLALAITTTTTRVNVETLLRVNLGEQALSWFDVWVCGESVKHKKPDPEVYHLALQQLDLPAASTIAFEDSYNGVQAACAANIPCLVTPNAYTDGDDFNGAFMVVSRLGDDAHAAQSVSGLALEGDRVSLAQLDLALSELHHK